MGGIDLIKKLLWIPLSACLAVPALAPWARAADDTYEQLKLLVDVLDYIQQNYVEEPDTKKLIYGAAAGMVGTLDPFSQFLEPALHKELKTETEGQFGGIGIRISKRDNWLTVITPIPGTPAYRLGILPHDRIVEIEGKSTKDITIAEALRSLRGKPGTKVVLSVRRAPEDEDGKWEPHEFTVKRAKIKITSVKSWVHEGDVGYMRIAEFSARTAGDLHSAMKRLKKKGVKSLILDLRNNPGGLLSSAVEIASDFLGDNMLIVYTKGRKIDAPQEFRSGSKAKYAKMPLIILVNEGSASGSEIIAGAFQDHRRAVIVGSRTYGKASVQSVIPLSDNSGLRLTVAKYYTPSGRLIHRDEEKKTGGITPDIKVRIPKHVERKLYSQWEMIYAKGKKPHSIIDKEDLVEDEVLRRATELLKARDVLGLLNED